MSRKRLEHVQNQPWNAVAGTYYASMDLSVAPQTEESVVAPPLSRGQLVQALEEISQKLVDCDLRLNSDDINKTRALRDSLVVQLRDQLLPKLHDADTPALVVIGGSTGAGKSTIVNSIFETELSEAGILRPTTRTPVLVAHPEDAPVLADHPLSTAVRTVTSEVIPPGLALIDASDLDSVSEENRALALRLLDAADLWVFATTASRYGDAAPWRVLEMTKEHGTSIAVVLNRVPKQSLAAVRKDLLQRLNELELGDAPFFVIPDMGPHEGLLPAEMVGEMRSWLIMLAGRHRAAGLLRRSEKQTWNWLADNLEQLAGRIEGQRGAVEKFSQRRQNLLRTPSAEIAADLRQGNCGQGAPAARWQSAAEDGGPLAGMELATPLRNGLFKRRLKARSESLAQVAQECSTALEIRISAALTSTETDVKAFWEASGTGIVNDTAPQSAKELISRWEQNLSLPTALPAGLEQDSARNLLVIAVTGVPGAQQACQERGLADPVETAREQLIAEVEQTISAYLPEQRVQALLPDPGLPELLRQRAQDVETLIRSGVEND